MKTLRQVLRRARSVYRSTSSGKLENIVSDGPKAQPEASPQPQLASELQIYRGYEDSDVDILRKFERTSQKGEPGFTVDFLNVKTRVSELFDSISHLSGGVSGLPVPCDFHAEAVEWIGVLKTVLTAGDRYVAMEWGAGWAPWLIAAGTAARQSGHSKVKLYGVEADPHHFEAMVQHFLDNGFKPKDHVLLNAAIGVAAGSARWPKEPDPKNQWGARPIRAGSDVDVDYLSQRIDNFIDVTILPARELLLREPSWDMIHIDIQGWEGEVCKSCIDILTERVKWVVIGVHSRILDAELLLLFHQAGWRLEHEKPTHFIYRPNQINFEAMVSVDGTQVWRNTKLIERAA